MNAKTLGAIFVLIFLVIIAILILLPGKSSEKVPDSIVYDDPNEGVLPMGLGSQNSGAVKIDESKSAGWTTYTNEEYGISFRYPKILEKAEANYSDTKFGEEPWVPIASFAGKENNSRIDIFLYDKSFEDYALIDQPGGSIYCYVEDRYAWYECYDPSNKKEIRPDANGPKTVDASFEAYTYKGGDSGWATNEILVPINAHGQVIVFHIYNWEEGYFEGETKEYVDLTSLASSISFEG